MAVRGPDPHNLRNLANKAGTIIDVDRPCVSCGYNLRGLRIGINCPECGMPSMMPTGNDDPLAVMPMRVILTLVRGCWVASICVFLMVGLVFADRFTPLPRQITIFGLAGLSLAWLLSAIWLTPAFRLPQAISRGFGPRSRTRLAARWLQLGWVIGLAAAAFNETIAAASGSSNSLLDYIFYAGIAAGMAGLVVLSILMERLADWARDEDAQRMFNWAMWSWPIAMLLYVPVHFFLSAFLAGAPGGRYPLGATVFLLLWVFAIATFPYGLFLLAKSVTLSIIHNIEYRQREERRVQRDDERHARAGARAANTEAQPMRTDAAAALKSAKARRHGFSADHN